MDNSHKLDAYEQMVADNVLNKMGLHDADKFQDEINDDLKADMDNHHAYYESTNYVEKPEFAKREENAKESARMGQDISTNELIPLNDMVIVRMKLDREHTTKSGIVLADLRKVKRDSPEGVVAFLNTDSEYEFKINDYIVVDLRKIKHRYNHQGGIHLILNKEDVMAVHA